MTLAVFDRLRQHADYTHKYNRGTGRHGWLRLTPAYSVRIVEELIGGEKGPQRVFDPFCGTATTALSAACYGHESVTTDINPFLVWLGRAKTAHYNAATITRSGHACSDVISLMKSKKIRANTAPPIHNIERWWSPTALNFLCHLQAAIDIVVPSETQEGTLLRVAFCRTLIGCSNAAFNHQSMSFRDNSQPEIKDQMDLVNTFKEDVGLILSGAVENPIGNASVLLHDARELSKLTMEKFNLVVTSPPYANRMSYVRELRPYMYWLGFLINGRDAGELDWLTIGGTWGIATSRLNDWKPEAGHCLFGELEKTLASISQPNNPNGYVLAAYIRKYCVDMEKHFAELRTVLAPRAQVHYIVGNSTFYGQLLSVEKIYAHIMHDVGFKDINIRPIRKRNSKKELIEFDVSARF